MEQKLLFNENIMMYEKRRPGYVKALFDDLFDYAALDSEKLAIEVGCGTGKATSPVLLTGCRVKAVEIGPALAAFSAEKYRNYPNLEVVNKPFEQFEMPVCSVDLVYSATAFHWIPEKIGYPKAYAMLKPGGVLALFWCKPQVSDENPELKARIQTAYLRHAPSLARPPQPYRKQCADIQWYFKRYGFRNLILRIYEGSRMFTASEYIELLSTYSDHMSLPIETREPLFSDIYLAVELCGGVKIDDLYDLHMGRKGE